MGNDETAIMPNQIVRADPTFRRYCLLGLGIVFLAGTVLLWKWPLLADRLRYAETSESLWYLRWSLTALFFPCFLFAGYFTFLGRRIMQSRQYPPSGMRVIKDTEVLRGDDVLRVLRMLAVLTALLVLVGFIGAVWFPWIFLRLFLPRY